MSTQNEATIAGLVTAAVLGNLPDWLLTFGEKILYGVVFAFATGFAHAAGRWLWSRRSQ